MTENLKEFTQACIDALYFTETGDEGIDGIASDAKIDKESRLDLEADCRSWWRQFGCYVLADSCTCNRSSEYSKAGQAGHDFWLTRNGHGAGFWDGDWSDNYAEMFTKGSKGYGQVDVFKGDDGKITF